MNPGASLNPDELAQSLFAAVRAGERNLVKLALAAGASPDARERDWPVISVASSRGCFDIVADLIEAGANVNACPEGDDRSPLHWAVACNHYATIERLLAAGADGDGGRLARLGWTPLHVAARYANAAVIAPLLQAGSDPNAKADGGITPLWVAAAAHNEAGVRLLLDAGADPNAIGETDEVIAPPLVAAAMALPFPQMMRAGAHVCDKTADRPMQMLMSGGANALATGHFKKLDVTTTALHCAAMGGALSTTSAIVAAEPASVFLWDSKGLQPVHVAVLHSDIVPAAEFAALHLIAQMPAIEPTRPPGQSRTLLHLAAMMDATRVLARLLQSDTVDVNAMDSDGQTPLHLAASHGHEWVIDLLVKAGADVSLHDNEGRRAMDLLELDGSTYRVRAALTPSTPALGLR